jgi:hypothetical protein
LSLLGPNILLNTLFSNTLSLRSSLNVSDQVSHSYNKYTYKNSPPKKKHLTTHTFKLSCCKPLNTQLLHAKQETPSKHSKFPLITVNINQIRRTNMSKH